MPLEEPLDKRSIDVTGLSDSVNRVALKNLFAKFGNVEVCFIPPIERRKTEAAYVKFSNEHSAEAAINECTAGFVALDGSRLTCEYRSLLRKENPYDRGGGRRSLTPSRSPTPKRRDRRRSSRDRSRSRDRDRSRRDRSRDRGRRRDNSRDRDRRR